MDEVLENYVLKYYSGLFTEIESLGFKAVAAEEKAPSGKTAIMRQP